MKKTLVKKGLYYDSVKLMLVTNEISTVEGVNNASVVMGTDLNKDNLAGTGLLTEEAKSAGPSDLIIGIEADNEESITSALKILDQSLNATVEGQSNNEYKPRTLSRGMEMAPKANVCIISIPGEYAAAEAREALEAGLHVMMFSDNVAIKDELELKKLAESKDLLLMGPDCGTALINGAPLCFANKVRKGSIGIVGASGTGSQEVMTLVHKLGGGISQLIGTGGRDLKEEIGGIMTIMGLRALEEDDNTKVITLVSKPPADKVVDKIIKVIKDEIKKPVVLNFLGKQFEQEQDENIYFASNLKDAATISLKVAGGEKINKEKNEEKLSEVKKNGYVKGLYSGGSLAYECFFRLKEAFGDVQSNLSDKQPVKDIHNLNNHVAIDFGEDEFTQGRPHPMIDSTLRSEIFKNQIDDESTAVIVLDFVLGYGANMAPQKAFLEVLEQAKNEKKSIPIIVVDVCGTNEDPQNYEKVISELKKAGVIVKNSNWEAVNYAISVVGGEAHA